LVVGEPVAFRNANYVNFVLPMDSSQSPQVQIGGSCVVHSPHAPGVLLLPVGPHFGVYPGIAHRRGEEGTVYLGITVRPDGTVSDPQVILSSGFNELDRAAIYSSLLWLYQPIPKPAQTVVDIRFSIH
jgi:TonB family protein